MTATIITSGTRTADIEPNIYNLNERNYICRNCETDLLDDEELVKELKKRQVKGRKDLHYVRCDDCLSVWVMALY